MYSLAVFTGGRPLCTEILPGHGRPPSTILALETTDTGLPDGKDRISLHSLILTQCWNVTVGQTDGRICRRIYSACSKSLYTIAIYPLVRLISWNYDQSLFDSHWRW